jgi:hypothetical protein
MDHDVTTRDLPIGLKTLAASTASALWRVVLMPLDTVMTHQQLQGRDGVRVLSRKIRACGPNVLFHGGLAAFLGNIVVSAFVLGYGKGHDKSRLNAVVDC